MAASVGSPQVKLCLAESPSAPGNPTSWVGPLVALGGMASRYETEHPGRQLIVTVSVPRRDFAAVLVGCGWVLASEAPDLDPPLEVLRGVDAGTPVRLVTDTEVLADRFVRFRDGDDPRIELRKTQWLGSKIRAAATLPSLEQTMRSPRPPAGSVARWAGLGATWESRLALPVSDLAIVGTRKWLAQDLASSLRVDGETPARDSLDTGVSDTIAGLINPSQAGAATWFCHLYASAQLADELPLPSAIRAAVLDGTGAIKYLTEIEAPVVVCILDRSVAEETAGEIVVQLRNSRGEPCSLEEDLGWRPPAGVEALAFTVAL